MTWPISMLFKINDMTQYILCVEIYIINIGQCHNIFNVLYVVKSALNTVCVLYIYWNITQRDAGNQLYSFSMWVYYIFYGFVASYSTKLSLFLPFFLLSLSLFLACLVACLLLCLLFLACLLFPPLFLNKLKVVWKMRTDFVVFYCSHFSQETPSHGWVLLC